MAAFRSAPYMKSRRSATAIFQPASASSPPCWAGCQLADHHFRLSRKTSPRRSRLYGHGLSALGLDPGRVFLVETPDDKQALWAIEEALRSGVPAAVIGMTGTDIDLKSSQRLNLAAGDSGRLLFLVQPEELTGLNVAMTRWRIGAASSRKRPLRAHRPLAMAFKSRALPQWTNR